MPQAITNTSPLVYLYRIGALAWLPKLFSEIWMPTPVANEIREGLRRGVSVPDPDDYAWLQNIDPRSRPSRWLSLELGPGELAAIALALENPTRIVLLDDLLARRVAQAAGLTVWGTLRVLLEAKKYGLAERIEPQVDALREAGMWFSRDIRQRILSLAGEEGS